MQARHDPYGDRGPRVGLNETGLFDVEAHGARHLALVGEGLHVQQRLDDLVLLAAHGLGKCSAHGGFQSDFVAHRLNLALGEQLQEVLAELPMPRQIDIEVFEELNQGFLLYAIGRRCRQPQEHLFPDRVIRLRDNLCRLVGLEREARIVLLHERAQGLGQLGLADMPGIA